MISFVLIIGEQYIPDNAHVNLHWSEEDPFIVNKQVKTTQEGSKFIDEVQNSNNKSIQTRKTFLKKAQKPQAVYTMALGTSPLLSLKRKADIEDSVS